MEVGSVILYQTRFWVSNSTVLEKAFYTMCLLFGSKEDTNSLRGSDNLSHAINRHTDQRNHCNACDTYIAVMCDKTVDLESGKQSVEIINKQKSVARLLHNYLERMIDCLLYLSSESISRRGDEESNFYDTASFNAA